MAKLFVLWLCAIPLLVQGQQADSSCLHIQGTLLDYATHQPLRAARLLARTSKGRQRVSMSGDSGTFSAVLPCGTTALSIECTGYRSQSVQIRFSANQRNQPITVMIPFIPVDRQNQDTPYLQTEQTSYVQSDSIVSDSKAVQHNTFLVTDAILGKPLSSSVCFFHTKTGEKRCLGTNALGKLERDFDQKDIIALEVRSTGYQPYDGNLIIEQLNGQSLQHEIRLQRELTLFSVNAPNATYCELRAPTKTIPLLALSGFANQYVSYEAVPGSYELLVRYGDKVIRRPVRLATGLNAITLNQPAQNTAPARVAVAPLQAITAGPALVLPDSIPMIYFEQGSYQLRSDSQAVLKQVAQYMKAHTSDTLRITGHTDNVGDPKVNRTLSLYRALATARFLTNQGITDSQLTKDGIGSRQPIAPNDTETNRALNRRVSLKLITAQ
ncbi:OmpA family protein [Spirosoma sp. KUDC1026]|uniref:OmpA family protein n=1 Tax=Spirosoma sp. KUDC1026 TaxID=2745947 RepID=UPI00159B8840|nr:OmpA family protein [Spirosoma sp. KUDC1026]QKZ12086.1 OmpA family protein [Spirosoma sp. KUDC1026]